MTPMSPTEPPPYTSWMFRLAISLPNATAAAMYTGLLPSLAPQKTAILPDEDYISCVHVGPE